MANYCLVDLGFVCASSHIRLPLRRAAWELKRFVMRSLSLFLDSQLEPTHRILTIYLESPGIIPAVFMSYLLLNGCVFLHVHFET